jgi:tetrahydromethanopterin S-methyltransferase subunit H
VDSPSPQARLTAVRHFAGTEVMPRLIYNSLDEHHTIEELDVLRESGLKSAILLTLGSRAVRPEDRLALLRDCLLPAAQRAGIENILVDTGVLDVPSVGWAAQTVQLIKDEYGYPTGCAPANAIYLWHKLRAQGAPRFEAGASVVLALPTSVGANFVFYGPIRNAPWAFAACAAMDSMIAAGGRSLGIRPVSRTHPLYRIF